MDMVGLQQQWPELAGKQSLGDVAGGKAKAQAKSGRNQRPGKLPGEASGNDRSWF